MDRSGEGARTEREELVSEVSHALRGPLQTIVGSAELLLSGRYGPVVSDQREAVERLIRRSEELDRRIETAVGLLDLELLDGAAGMPVDPSFVVKEALDRMEAEARDRGVELESDLDGDLPALRGRIGVLRRLFAVSVRFVVLDAASPAVRVRVRSWPPEEGRIRFAVLREGDEPGSGAGAEASETSGLAGGAALDETTRLELLLARRATAVLRGEMRVVSGNPEGEAGVFLTLPLFGGAQSNRGTPGAEIEEE